MSGVEYSSSVRPVLGRAFGGDRAMVLQRGEDHVLVVVDVLGRGLVAHREANRIEAHLRRSEATDPLSLLQEIHEVASQGPGCALGICWVTPEERTLHYVAIGSTQLRYFGHVTRTGISRDGVVGGRIGTPRLQDFPLVDRTVVVLHTDGVSPEIADLRARDLWRSPIEERARDIIARYGHPHDDAACLIFRFRA